ncbi:hypothetical protein [Pseudomonas brassicacearum]|uniref:hypothetical protein n=1 Tax=Pseudomonas brassicacearum TaxID=930166 RepID=UPI0011CDE97D|nr:hypothetical protein [Pseudomonas brassicacearum]
MIDTSGIEKGGAILRVLGIGKHRPAGHCVRTISRFATVFLLEHVNLSSWPLLRVPEGIDHPVDKNPGLAI